MRVLSRSILEGLINDSNISLNILKRNAFDTTNFKNQKYSRFSRAETKSGPLSGLGLAFYPGPKTSFEL